jgi:P27 family predicted phage terminase small subunit
MAGGKRGPAPKPRWLKLLEGTFRADRDEGMPDPPAVAAVPKPPSWLRKDGRAEWRRVAGQLVTLTVLTEVDVAALEGYCAAYDRAVRADRALSKGRLTMLSPQGLIPRPEVAIARTAWAEARRFAQEFGLTPASRSRVPHAGDAEGAKTVDPWDVVGGSRAS